MGRPTGYKREYVEGVYKYIASCKDTEIEFHKTRGEKSDSYDRILAVKLPTHEGFASYLNVAVKSLYTWAEAHPDFLQALEEIKAAQKEKLIAKGLSGEYNSTIAKLILSANHGMKERSDLTTDDKPIETNAVVFADFNEAGSQ